MESVDLASIVNDLQRLIYSTRDTTVEENSIATAHTLQYAFQRATAEFVRPAIAVENGQKQNGQLLDQQLRMLKLENRALQNELETVARTTEHVQQSHRKTMEAVLRGEVPSNEPGGGWVRHPLEQMLSTEARKCEVAKHTPSEEQEHLRVFACQVKQILKEAEAKFYNQREMAERVAFENFVMRNLLENRGEKVDYQELVRSFREVTPTDVPKKDEKVVAEFTHADIKKASEHFEEEFWAAHEKDRVEMEEKAIAEEEKRRKEQERDEGASVVEGLLRQYQRSK